MSKIYLLLTLMSTASINDFVARPPVSQASLRSGITCQDRDDGGAGSGAMVVLHPLVRYGIDLPQLPSEEVAFGVTLLSQQLEIHLARLRHFPKVRRD